MSYPWKSAGTYSDILYEKWDGIAKITINRPDVRNAFRPQTLFDLQHAFLDAREDPAVGVVILAGEGDKAFCSGGDQSIRGDQGYVGGDKVPRLNVLDLQKQIRSLPKPVIASLNGTVAGAGDDADPGLGVVLQTARGAGECIPGLEVDRVEGVGRDLRSRLERGAQRDEVRAVAG